MSAFSTVAGARSARQSRDAGGGRDATGRPGKQPPFRGGHRGPWLLLAGQRRPWDTVSPDTRASAKAGVGPVVISDVLIASMNEGPLSSASPGRCQIPDILSVDRRMNAGRVKRLSKCTRSEQQG